MSFARRNFVRSIFALGAALTVAMPALAQTAGKDYTPITPAQPTDDAAKIEVLEFFSYGCPHCSDFHPLISAWAAKQPGDVVFKRVPVSFGRAAWANAAKLYYTLEATGDLAKLDGDVFKAIHSERVNLFDEKTILERNIYNRLREVLEIFFVIHDPTTFDEMRNYVQLPNGKFGNANGSPHDDTVMALAIACTTHYLDPLPPPLGTRMPFDLDEEPDRGDTI